MDDKNSFVFYRSFYEAIQDLKEKDQLKMFKAICELALNGKELELTNQANTMFKLIKPQITANNERYINGKKGGRPKKTTGFENKKTNGLTSPKANENVNDNENVNVNDNGFGFSFPTLAEIISYASDELKISDKIFCEKFFNHYQSVGWVSGTGQAIQDWKATFNKWAIEDKLIPEKKEKEYIEIDENGNLVKVKE